ncbi:TIGR03826 family flagellar region protein [Kurthia senegalensis]|uniref:TIGR03826 family flagellar region protein n=1 Tax=Kurthia senegalensis TaxID=1033740 RepID=UPI0002898070|nr:TIGR03826 family flagellar region protein [Kurthia senegalensis]
MGEVKNCPICGQLFNDIGIRDVCGNCGADEERKYEEVYRFLRRRENRAATIERIVEATGCTEEMLHKWVRKGRLQPALFPNLGYPCDNCGKLTQTGKLCESCSTNLQKDLNVFEAGREFREGVARRERGTYLSEKTKRY